MRRAEFVKELEYLLQDIPSEDKEDAIAYYRDYLEEAGDEHEEESIREFGSPERVAAIIRADLEGRLDEGGEFTESGYKDERFKDPRYQVATRPDRPEERTGDEDWQEAGEGGGDKRGQDKRWQGRERGGWLARGSMGSRVVKLILVIILICVASPVFLGVGGGITGIAVGLLALFLAIVALLAVFTITAWIGTVALLVLGFGILFAHPWSGILVMGGGVFAMGVALLGTAASFMVYGKLIPFCICSVVNGIGRMVHGDRRRRV